MVFAPLSDLDVVHSDNLTDCHKVLVLGDQRCSCVLYLLHDRIDCHIFVTDGYPM